MKVTKEEIEAAISHKGGYSRATLAKWGVPWPPVEGWKERLINGEPQQVDEATQLRKEARQQLDMFS